MVTWVGNGFVHARIYLSSWHLPHLSPFKVWFHDGEILRAKLCLRNADGCTSVILLNFATFFAFAVSRTQFYSLAKRNFFSRSVIQFSLLRMHEFISREIFSHFAEIKRSWNQALIFMNIRFVLQKKRRLVDFGPCDLRTIVIVFYWLNDLRKLGCVI